MAIESEKRKKQSPGNIGTSLPKFSEGGADDNEKTNLLARRCADYLSKNNPPQLSPKLVERLNKKIAEGGTLTDQDMEDMINNLKDHKPTTYTDPNPPRG